MTPFFFTAQQRQPNISYSISTFGYCFTAGPPGYFIGRGRTGHGSSVVVFQYITHMVITTMGSSHVLEQQSLFHGASVKAVVIHCFG
jgi:hypothetical protein